MRPKDIVSTQEACRLLNITRPTLYSWIAQGKVKPWGKLGGHEAWFFLRKEVNRVKAKGLKYERAPLSSPRSKPTNHRRPSPANG
ncbi:MAG: helix-turn-helix domain-containing protein [Elusimicrobia bacterium]|nr:helix-turn-helix domain-containing protein [Elusimicrobiota bacterium]